jgi:hypothetical protein
MSGKNLVTSTSLAQIRKIMLTMTNKELKQLLQSSGYKAIDKDALMRELKLAKRAETFSGYS